MYNDEQFYMVDAAGTIARAREIVLVTLAGMLLAVAMTWPLAANIAHTGRMRDVDADGQYSIWNVAWVARTLVADPVHLFDANIFYPHRRTLAYSEANILAGAAAVPFYWTTRNAWLSLNVVCLLAFTWAFVGAYVLLRHLSGASGAAFACAILYAYCPYVFGHLSHIQLLMTGGIPLSLLMLHRVADAPSLARALSLGIVLAIQALACAYYGIFAGLLVGYAALVLASTRSLWRSATYWTAVALAAVTSSAIVFPFFRPYLRVQSELGFARSTEDAQRYAANLQSYIVSSSRAHGWLLDIAQRFPRWTESLFPGILAIVLGIAGVAIALRTRGAQRTRTRETMLLYGGAGILAFWASFGPHAGLYRWLAWLPVFDFLHAPSRFGLIVVLALAVFACLAVRAVLSRLRGGTALVAAVAFAALAIADVRHAPLRWWDAPERPSPYALLAQMPRAPMAEFPFYGDRVAFPLHAQYMLFSTWHWMPLVNGYSDILPDDFRADAPVLAAFPSRDSLLVLERHRVRYIGIHWDMYGPKAEDVRRRMPEFAEYLRPLAADDRMALYEVVRYP